MSQSPNSQKTKRLSAVLQLFSGFVLWVAFNGVMAIVTIFVNLSFLGRYDAASKTELANISNVLYVINFLVNIVGLIVLAFKRRWIALGALIAFASVLLVLALFGGLTSATGCFKYLTGVNGIAQ